MSESTKNLSDIVTKLKEIDNVFKFGEKMIPVIEGFVSFISDFVPFVEQVSGSIQDSRSKIPEASNQIDKVTNATELAMTEVLDKIDEINIDLNDISNCLDDMVEHRIRAEGYVTELCKEIKDNENAKVIFKKLLESIDVGLTLEMMKNKVRQITANTDQITMSLQVQDITAQQLAAVNHLIISVQHKLGGLLEAFNSTGYNSSDNLEISKLPDVHFDANASYNPSSNQQDDVDSIIKNEKASQEEIDKLFS
ncbi:MAG: protein phosphatase CheZ [Ignavibacteriae bacterium]|nr:protein phosphatase CheZ [Ignavibacteriota bacterium]MCB9206133.1 protein phosphatase CheZ [Ignavibacteriales bacterium]MCB9209406.1 protein phosphatase CheZ [Ignavibacteriales bacterium]MCB9258049.1 protein phosphatase CheZ [Ignavibacteriales bacterium]